MDLAQTLQHARSHEAGVRNAAEASLRQAEETQLGPFMTALVAELGNPSRDEGSRQLAGLYFKNMLKAEDETLAEQKKERWLAVPQAEKQAMRNNLLQNLLDANNIVRHTAAQCIGAVAAIDVAQDPDQWPELLPAFLQVVQSPDVAEHSKESTLEACGYMCEELESGALSAEQTNQVLTSIVDGIKAGRPETTRCAAVVALQNALEFCERNFEVDVERNMIMQNVCEACQSPEMKTRVKAFECLGRIAEKYYKYMTPYIETIYGLTINAIQHSIQSGDEDIGMMALEFWTTVCDEEIEIAEILEDADEGEHDLPENHKFVPKIVQHITPVLLEAMTKQDDDEEDVDNWSLASAAAVCLENISKTVCDEISKHVIPFVSQHISSQDWHFREAATMAFGSILEGPQDEDGQFKTIIEQAVPQFLIAALKDPSVFVKDATAWTLARICEIHPGAVPSQYISAQDGLIQNLLGALDDVPRVAEKACTCIHHMAEHAEEIGNGVWLGPTFMPIVEKLFGVTDRPDWQECDLRATAYEAICMMIENHPKEARPTVQMIVPEVLRRLKATFEMQPISAEDKQEQDRLQAVLSAVLHITIRSFEEQEEVVPIADQVMELLLQVLMAKNSTASEEAFMAVGAVADKTAQGEYFARYLNHLMPVVLTGLRNWEEYQVCQAAVGLVGDISRACPTQLAPFCDQLVEALLKDLEEHSLNRVVKPTVLATFGDLASACEGNFVKYLDATMPMLVQAAATQVEDDNEELLEFLDELREGVLDAYIGILDGLSNPKNPEAKQRLLHPTNYVQPIFGFIQMITNDLNKGDAVCKNATNLLGDLARCLGKPIAGYFQQPWVSQLLKEQAENDEERQESNAQYANEQIKQLFA